MPSMNTKLSLNAAICGFFVASLITASAYAGPGAQYWQHVENSAKADKTVTTVPVCPGSQEVVVTALKPSWSNGRGPLIPVQIGTKRVCTVCPVRSVATSGWLNGRGPKTKTEETKSGAQHDCTVNCPLTKA